MKNALTGVERALFWTLVFAAFAAAAAGLAARAVDRLAAQYESQRQSYAIVRVITPEGAAGMAAAQATLNNASAVTSAAPMTQARAAALLAQWGAGAAPGEMPTLHLIEIELSASAGRDAGADLEAALAANGVTAEVIGAPDAASGGGVASQVRVAAFWAAVLFSLVMALIISLAARGLAARRRELVTVMTDCGATRAQAAGQIADEAAVLGLYAGLLGGALAGVAGLMVMLIAIPGASADTLPNMILPIDLAPIAAAPLGAAIAAGAGARAAAGLFHAQAARLG
jgi:cell division transport system permease protein